MGLSKPVPSAAYLPWSVATKGSMHPAVRGVGIATTQSVVLSSVLILIADYFLTAMMFQ